MTPGGMPSGAATASGWIALLQEEDASLKQMALEKMLESVDILWSEVAEALPDLEAMAEDKGELAPLAAAVASRVFFHLQEPTQALRLALEAGPQYFDPMDATSSYVERLVAAALDAYVAAQQLDGEKMDVDGDAATEQQQQQQQLPMDQLQAMIDRLLDTSCQAGNYTHALGMALEARQIPKVQSILEKSGNDLALLKHAIHLSVNVVQSKAFRIETLTVIAGCLKKVDDPIAVSPHLMQVYQLLLRPGDAAKVLSALLTTPAEPGASASNASLLGLQLCFDLMDSGDQAFCTSVAQEMPKEDDSEEAKLRLEQAQRILVGGFSAELALSFLHKQSNADRLILENLKRCLEERSSGSSRNSVLHGAAVVTHAYLYAGTTNDSFLRDYLDWMKKASNW